MRSEVEFIFWNMNTFLKFVFLSFFSFLIGCTTLKTEHHITLDHTITIKIEKEVDDFLDDLYEDEE